MSIDVTDVLEERRKDVERAKAFAAALEEGNLALAECFAGLAVFARDAAEERNLYDVMEALDCIEKLSDIGHLNSDG